MAYPYPDSPQHIGHARTYSLTDVHARYMRMRGYNVLFPMAFHYTGTPVFAISKRLAAEDKGLIDIFVRVYRVPKEALESFVDPLNIARYFHEEMKLGMKEMGYSIDWRREFTTVDPHYNRFIEWQFQMLKKAGFISQGSHPVGWCPSCGNPVSQHDTLGDVEPQVEELTLIKFTYDGLILPTATLRPETIFGVTNLWVNPKAEYVEALVNDERWIVSVECVKNLQYLGHDVKVVKTFLGKEFIGKKAKNPITQAEELILPADFVDPDEATGVVMSVPAHAPYDYVALANLKEEVHRLKEYGLTIDVVNAIKPISIITIAGHSEVPAEDVVKQMNVTSQLDPKLKEATRELYRRELHQGTMKENAGAYANLSVIEARARVKEDLIRSRGADLMYELADGPVFCRCGAKCLVKIFKDQWFINYGDVTWKALAHQQLSRMEILPDELRQEFKYVIDWLHERACARKSGLGTKLPWDPDWIIESLSDSVIYMAYYTIVKHIKDYGVRPEQLTDAVFDYVFLGVGDLEKVANDCGLSPKVLRGMREEFLYFYPLDSRHSGRDLVPNHLTFMIFNHVALFPEGLRPRQIVVNGSVLMEGQKMSKSLGNVIPLRDAVEMYGADPLRIAVLTAAEPLQDVNFSPSLARSAIDRLERLYKFAFDVLQTAKGELEASLKPIDRWMISRLQNYVRMTTEAMDELMVRKAAHISLYELDRDIQWYLRRTLSEKEDPRRREAIAKALKEVLNVQVRMLAPLVPHVCEEIWEMMDEKGFVSLAPWPMYDESKVDIKVEESERLIESMLEDTLNILKVIKKVPRRICYYTAASWKWKVYLKILERSILAYAKISELMKDLMKDEELKGIAKEVVEFSSRIIREVGSMSEERKRMLLQMGAIDEFEVLKDSVEFLQKELRAKVDVWKEDDLSRYDPRGRASLASPGRPAIYVE